MSIPSFPKEITEYIRDYSIRKHPYHEKADIYVLTKEDKTLYLKSMKNGRLKQEYDILKWIDGRLPVPDPIKYLKIRDIEYLITSSIEGTPVYKLPIERRDEGIRVLTEALKLIHTLDHYGCPRISTIEDKIRQAKRKADRSEKKGILAKLEEFDLSENLIFTHGDYCLPNILVTEKGELGGVIDWDYGGLADQYVDFVSCIWSINYNFGEGDWVNQFLDAYGVELDWERFEFFRDLINLID